MAEHQCGACESCAQAHEEQVAREAAEKWWAGIHSRWNLDATPLYVAAVLMQWHREVHPYDLDADEDDPLIRAWIARIEKVIGAESAKQVSDLIYQISGSDLTVSVTAPEFKGWALIDTEYAAHAN